MSNPWKLKQELCEIGRRVYERGLLTATEGNLSARMGADRVLCTPSMMCKGFLKPEDLCVVDMTGKQISGQRKPTSEVPLHLTIYRERPDVGAVVHTHPPHATAFAISHTPIPKCVLPEVEVFLGEVPHAPYATPGTQEFADTVVPFLREANIVLLANHGAVSWGKTLEEALHRTETLEAYCRMLILAHQLGAVQQLKEQNVRDLLAIKQRVGLSDRRIGLENVDLCGNNVLGRGFGTTGEQPCRLNRSPSEPVSEHLPNAEELEAVVKEIADRVLATVKGGSSG